jgi:hypothetical protein
MKYKKRFSLLKHFATASNFTINASIISATLLLATISKGEEVDYGYSPSIELSTRNSKKRNITELDYMQPIWSNNNNLSLVDLKLKLDNNNSKEINIGLVYRHNFNDKFVLGVYSYLDHRRTGDNFAVSGWTPGIEALSKYVDVRVNFYLPQNKKKKIANNNNKIVVIKGTSIYAISGGHKYEYPLKGYDIEIGGPVFGFSEELNSKFATKLFAAKYDFRNKNTRSIIGTRFRLEQPLGSMKLGKNSGLYFTLNAETQYDKVTKRQNTIGLSAKLVFDDKKSTKKSIGLKSRMMDKVIRDVDIVTSKASAAPVISKFNHHGKEISHIYYVGAANNNYQGDGTKEAPFSLEQLQSVNISDAMIVVTTIDPTQGGQAISEAECRELTSLPQVVNGKEAVKLSTVGTDKVEITIKDEHGITISGNHTAVEIYSIHTGSSMNTSQSVGSSTILLEETVSAKLDKPLEIRENQINLETPAENIRLVQEAEAVDRLAQIENQRLAQEAENQRLAQIENQRLAQEAEAVDRLAQIEQLAAGIVDSGVDRNTLSVEDRAVYNLILEVANLNVVSANNPYAIREREYQAVKTIIDNAITLDPTITLQEIKTNIDADVGIDFAQRTRYKVIAEKILDFDGTVAALAQNGGQQGVGLNGRSARDITSVTSLQRLQELYGIVDGTQALELTEKIAINAIRANMLNLSAQSDEQIKLVAVNAARVLPTAEYLNAARSYVDKSVPVVDENQVQRLDRLDERARDKLIIDEKLKSENSAINKYMAAYRALERIKNDPNGLYVEKITGRYNVPEVLGQTLRAITDVKEAKYVAATNNLPLDNQAIFNQQKENLETLFTALADGQRAYNRNDHINPDISGLVDIDRKDHVVLDRDNTSCAHGVCVRIIDTMIGKHQKVSVSDSSPASFAAEFNTGVKQAVAKLPAADKLVVTDFHDDITNLNVVVDGLGGVTFTEQRGAFPMPYQRVLGVVTKDLATRYNYLNPNSKLQLVKKNDALTTFENLGYLDFSN